MDHLAEVVEQVARTIERHALLEPREPVVCLISGGADSTLLAHVLARLGHPLVTVHCAHALRGEQSSADASACRLLARALGAEHHEVAAAVSDGAGVEDRARQLRRSAGERFARGRTIATGHTRDDRVETILYRLASSPGRRAFAALGPSDGAGRVRPLIELGREQVREALASAQIAWREDPSNRDLRFARNRVRLELLPQLRLLHPHAEQNLLATAEALAAEQEAVEAAARQLFAGPRELVCRAVASSSPALVRVALQLLCGEAVSSATVRRVIELAAGDRAAGRVPLPSSRELERRAGVLALAGPLELKADALTPFGGFTLRCAAGTGELALDLQLAPRLSVRGALRGDRLAGHERTVARMLLERKVPRAERSGYPVVLADGVPVCLPGIACATPAQSSPGLLVELM